ncbi:hypothetical protein CPLU01_05944 [Colletotrichum plurivorum]|uniref:Succinate dehydrogenase assembly factor 2, mitochondrial n=1 Tax=Colletotrichum plurivorum TaxID=2175906 RepID=A0A8H6KK84_9PEZI|nr:hypothetical protein CPLU01_05944 [Colletotrichum plurivorum]
MSHLARITRARIGRPAARRLTKAAPAAAVPLVARRTLADKQTPPNELAVGELEGIKFRVEPLRRTGEDERTMRARLLYQSRKRGTLESDLLMSTFANENLPHMTKAQMQQYDLFLDENDWDIYYWATQEEVADSVHASPTTQKKAEDEPTEAGPSSGEWSNTIGTFKAGYRPVPARWKGSEILEMLREHVRSRRADGTVGVHRDVQQRKEGGLGFMPPLFDVDKAGKN